MPDPFNNPKTIFHIDYDSFFASVEQQYNPDLRNKPIGVTGSSLTKGIICAASIEAKKLGVKTAMPLFKAKKLCPQIIPIQGDFKKYQYVHKKSLEIFGKYTDMVEPFSIDEAFLDMTKTIKFFGTPKETIRKLKNDIKTAFGNYITCSIGVGPNKLLAKLTSDINKPNGHFVTTKENLNNLLHSTPLTEFCGIGTRIYKRLNEIGIYTTADLQLASNKMLVREFGNVYGKFLKNLSFGIGSPNVAHIEYKSAPKSIGHQHTLEKNTKNHKIIKFNLRRLSEMTARRLRKNKMVGKTISIYLRGTDFTGHSERKTLWSHTDSGKKIFETAGKIFDTLNWKKEIRLVGVTISNLKQKSIMPLPLFEKDQKNERVTNAADLINDKFGNFTIVPANTLKADTTKGKISSFLRH